MRDASLIGRAHSLHVLDNHVTRTRASHGGLLFLTGEPGIGKTSLARYAAQEAARQNMCVLRGSCRDGGAAPGFWPWVQVVRGLRRGPADPEWDRATADTDRVLATLSGQGAAEGLDRFHLCDLVTTLLCAASRVRPVLVVLEDLHWVDPASLELLEFTAQYTWFERLLVLGTYREEETRNADDPSGAPGSVLSAKATTLRLTGLDVGQVGELFGRTVGRPPEAGLAEEVHRRTGGNPFFVEETARLWSAGRPLSALSPGVRAVVRHRLSPLTEPTLRVLGVASVLGQRFASSVLARAAGISETDVDRLLTEAADAHLVAAAGGGDLVFVHDLIRETLYRALDATHRRRLHAAAVRALLAGGATAPRAHPADLAHHAHHARDELDADEAVEVLVTAARDAANRLAHEEAVTHYGRALDRLGRGRPRLGVPLALDLGLALQLAGEHDRSWVVFEDAAERAREHGDATLLGRVALTLCEADVRGDTTGLKDRALRAAHAALLRPSPDGEGLSGTGAADATVEVARSVAASARRVGDDDALHVALWVGGQALWGPGTTRERAGSTAELMEVSRRRGDRWMEHIAMSLRWVALLELGDPAFLRHLHGLVEVARHSGSPRMRLTSAIDRSVVHTFTGRFAEAERLLAEVAELSGPHANYHQYFRGHHRWATALLRGGPDEMTAVHRDLRRTDHPQADLLESITALELGHPPPNHPLPLPTGVPGEVAGDTVWERAVAPLRLRHDAQSAAASRDPDRCEVARTALEAYRGQWLISLLGWDVSGPALLWAGVLDAAQERWDAAVRELTEARRTADRLHARPWSLRAGVELGAALLARGAPGDRDTAVGLLRGAESQARRLGMLHLAERARRTSPAVPAARRPETAAGSEGYADEFTRTGTVWRLRYAGRTVHVPDAKGLRDLHCLLSRPGTPVPAVWLLAPDGGALVAAQALGGDPVLDDAAKSRYRRRLELLDEEIDRASQAGDRCRVTAFEGERAALLAELRRAVGLGGRTRRLGDAGERARKNVTARIKDTLRRLDGLHPELAAHLRATVSTGTACCYTPDREIRWRL